MSEPPNNAIDMIREIHGRLPAMEEKLNDIVLTINGPKGEPEKGVVVRMDRLEQSEKRRSVLSKTAVGAACAALAGMIVSWFKGS